MTFYTITVLQELLKLNPKQAKALMHTDGFPSIKIGIGTSLTFGIIKRKLFGIIKPLA